MRKFYCLLLSVAMVLGVDAFGETQIAPAKDAKVTKEKKCVFPKSRKRAPNWICNANTEGLAVTAVGSAAKSGAGIAFMEQMAAADARVNLARDLRASVQNKIKGSEDSTSKDATERDGAMISKISNDSLQGTRIVKSAFGPNGTLYVLVGLDEASANKLIESISAEYLEQKRK